MANFKGILAQKMHMLCLFGPNPQKMINIKFSNTLHHKIIYDKRII